MDPHNTLVADTRRVLSAWFEDQRVAETVTQSRHLAFREELHGADVVARLGSRIVLAIECKASGDAAAVAKGAVQAREAAVRLGRHCVPVVAVPYMGAVGKRICAEGGVSWIDLSGNAHLLAPGLALIVEGKPNKFTRRGRPSSALAPKSARIARLLLMEPARAFRQKELVRESGLDDGFVSRIVRRLDADHLIDRDERGAIRVRDPDLLLDAWREAYDFSKHRIVAGHITGKGEELIGRIAHRLDAVEINYAITGLAAAWLQMRYASFRLVTFFVDRLPGDEVASALGFHEEPSGANVWLVMPNDASVFFGATRRGRLRCVHPLQTYLDLRSQPERAPEVAEQLRHRFLRWGRR